MVSLFIEPILKAIKAAPKNKLFTSDRAQCFDTATLLEQAPAKELLEKYRPEETIYLASDIRTHLCKREDYTGISVALFAHYSTTGEVNDAVYTAVQHITGLGYELIFISGNAEIQYDTKLEQACSAILTRTCTGYDFTSWKAAFERFPSLYKAKECLLTNDSIFFPIGSAVPIHKAMVKVSCDFWGLVASAERCHHVQSYYLVLRESTLQHPCFTAFIHAINTNAEKMHSVFAYELTFTPWLAKHGLVPASYIPLNALPKSNINPAHYFWRWLLEDANVPIIKRDLLRYHHNDPYLQGWQKLVREKDYDPHYITNAINQ